MHGAWRLINLNTTAHGLLAADSPVVNQRPSSFLSYTNSTNLFPIQLISAPRFLYSTALHFFFKPTPPSPPNLPICTCAYFPISTPYLFSFSPLTPTSDLPFLMLLFLMPIADRITTTIVDMERPLNPGLKGGLHRPWPWLHAPTMSLTGRLRVADTRGCNL